MVIEISQKLQFDSFLIKSCQIEFKDFVDFRETDMGLQLEKLSLSDRVPCALGLHFFLFPYFVRYKFKILLIYCCGSTKSSYTNFAESNTAPERCG